MPALNQISQTAPDAVTILRILCFCDPENIPISILKQGCGALNQEERSDIPVASAVSELRTVINLFQSSVRLSKAIQEIQRLSLAVYTSEGSDRTVRIHDLVQLLLDRRLSPLQNGSSGWRWPYVLSARPSKGSVTADPPEIGVDAASASAISSSWRALRHVRARQCYTARRKYMGGNILQRVWALWESGRYAQADMGPPKSRLRRGASFTLTSMANLGLDILEPRTLEGGRRVGGASDGDKEEGAGRGASRYAE
ncbi:hypothetical protein LPUS_01024 [Lasallia pustulata]|uniref:Uncharacterized protein n=1 Tax=Lasallia pustulata TaxID=136370 RepID=A0A1W5CSP8_9LECA|nr:hypothetical protein LPUS_01024 [Lasallia pustulata]